MNSKVEKLFQKVIQFQRWSFIAMSIIVAYHIVTPRSIGGIILTIILFFPIFNFSQKLLERIMWIK